MKKILCMALAVMCLSCVFSGCSDDNQPPEGFKAPPDIGFMAAGQFDGYKLGTISSFVTKDTINNHLPAAYVYTYKSPAEGLSALRDEKIHGMVLPVLYADNEIDKSEGIGKIEQTFIEQPVCAIFLNTSKYVLPIDAVFTSIKANGTAKKIALIHSPYATEDDVYTRPSDYEKAKNRVIKVGICSDENYPFNYRKDGELVGVNVDMAYEIAAGANADLEIKEYPKDELEKALKDQEVDVILSDYVYSESLYAEGSSWDTSLLLSESYYDASMVIVAKSDYIGYSKDVLPNLMNQQ